MDLPNGFGCYLTNVLRMPTRVSGLKARTWIRCKKTWKVQSWQNKVPFARWHANLSYPTIIWYNEEFWDVWGLYWRSHCVGNLWEMTNRWHPIPCSPIQEKQKDIPRMTRLSQNPLPSMWRGPPGHLFCCRLDWAGGEGRDFAWKGGHFGCQLFRTPNLDDCGSQWIADKEQGCHIHFKDFKV